MDELLIRVAEQVAKHGGGVVLSCAPETMEADNRENGINAFGMDVRPALSNATEMFFAD